MPDSSRIPTVLLAVCFTWAAAIPTAAQTVRGALVDEHTGQPIALGRVVLVDQNRDSVAGVITTEQGFFELSAPKAGSYSILADGFGFWSNVIGPFVLDDDEVRIVETRLAARPMPVPGLTVDADRPTRPDEMRIGYLVSTGFYDRMNTERGEFITPGEIFAADVTYVQQLFFDKRSTRVVHAKTLEPISARQYARAVRSQRRDARFWLNTPDPFHVPAVSRRGAPLSSIGPWGAAVTIRSPTGGYCAPWLYVDGIRMHRNPGETLADVLPIQTVLAVEIYRAPFEGTLAFRDISRCECGALVVWTSQAQ